MVRGVVYRLSREDEGVRLSIEPLDEEGGVVRDGEALRGIVVRGELLLGIVVRGEELLRGIVVRLEPREGMREELLELRLLGELRCVDRELLREGVLRLELDRESPELERDGVDRTRLLDED